MQCSTKKRCREERKKNPRIKKKHVEIYLLLCEYLIYCIKLKSVNTENLLELRSVYKVPFLTKFENQNVATIIYTAF